MTSALERIAAYMERHWPSFDTPGLALGLTHRDGVIGEVHRGLADIAAPTPIATEHRFQIGSISKGLTSMAVLTEVEAGRIALDAPVTAYLPWFAVPSRFERPITIHHLLSHTAGLACGLDSAADATAELQLLVLETEIGTQPGTHFLYSNAGFKALGLVIEVASGRPWWEVVHERVMEPIGMGESDVIITNDVRARLAVGYTSPLDGQPWRPDHGWIPSPWFESATADGTICASVSELTAYARLLLARGRGVITEQSFERMVTPTAKDPKHPGHVYGYGVRWIDGRRFLGHSGGMIGFTGLLLVDVVSGFGAAILMNSGYGSYRLELARFALECLAAESSRELLPEVPPTPQIEPDPARAPGDGAGPPGWEAYAGRYRSWNPWAPILDVTERKGRLWASLTDDASDFGEGEGEMVPLPDGRFRLGDEGSPNRLRFESFVKGRAVRAFVDGALFVRVAS